MTVLILNQERDTTTADRYSPIGGAAPKAEGRPTAPTLVHLQSVSKRFATVSGIVHALDDVSLDIRANEFFTLLGPSGCGKTTLLRLLAGFEHPDQGKLLLDDRDVRGDPPNKRPVNIVFQSYALFPHMSVAKNVAFGLERQGRPRIEIDERVAAMLKLVELDQMTSRKPAQLSGGQQQRVALARALAPNPKLLLLDEPLSALDTKLRRGMQVELKRLQRETGITFLLVTHDQEEALSMSDRVAVMNEGRIEQIGTPRAIYETPRSRMVAMFFGANVLPGKLVGANAPFVAIRPERVEVTPNGEGEPGHVVDATYLGAISALTIALERGPSIKIERPDAVRHTPGSKVVCRFPATAITPLEA